MKRSASKGVFLASLAAVAFALLSPAGGQTWTRAHGGADAAGFADVETSPAKEPIAHAAVGPMAPGVGPVIGSSATAYLGTMDGHLVAVAENGVKHWDVAVTDGVQILASPLIGADGTIYVAYSLGLGRPPAHDHRKTRSWLAKYDGTGKQLWVKPLPVLGNTSGAAVSLTNMGSGANEVILVAAADYTAPRTYTVALSGFQPSGVQLFVQDAGGSTDGRAMYAVEQSTASCAVDVSCWLGMHNFREQPVPSSAPPTTLPADRALPADVHAVPVGIAFAGATIVVNDGYRGIRGYQYAAGRLVQTFHKLDARYITAASAVLPNLRSIYAVYPGRIAFSGPRDETFADLWQAADHHEIPVEAPPTRLANGRLVTVDRDGRLITVESHTPKTKVALGAQTVAAVAASRNHFYVSTVNRLVSFNAATEAEVGQMPWSGGGLSPPAIGANGTVYAVANGTLYIFKRSITLSDEHAPEHHLGMSPPHTP